MTPQFLNESLNKTDALQGSYEPTFVALSYAVAALAAFCALTIAKNNLSERSSKSLLQFWHLAGALALGTGIWAMHFLGMLAFRLPIPIHYDPLITALSFLPAFLASWVVIKIVSRKTLAIRDLAIGGVLMGSGIGAMHYSGMAGMKLDAMMYYDPATFAVSVIVAVALSIASLYSTFRLKRLANASPLAARIVGASFMGLAIGTMHYTGMAATYYLDACAPEAAQASSTQDWLLGGIIATTSVILIGLTTLAGIVDYNLRRAEASALETQEILTRVLENTQQGYVRLDSLCRIQQLNKSMCRILGLPHDQAIGKTFGEFLSAETKREFPGMLETLATGLFEISVQDAEGKSIPCLYHATETLDRQGSKNGIVGLLTDITEIRKREAISRERAENVANIMDNLPTGVLLIDENARIQLFNESCEAMFGLSKNEILGGPVTQLVASQDKDALAKYVSGLTPRASRIATVEFLGKRNDGTHFPIEFGANEIIVDGKIMLVGAVHDITVRKQEQARRKELEVELLQSSKLEAVGQLAGGIAHEINTPIQFIGDNLDFLETEFASILPLLAEMNESSREGKTPPDLQASLKELDIDFLAVDIPQAITQSIAGVREVSRIVLSMKEFSHPGAQTMQPYDLHKSIENTLAISKAEWKGVAEIELDFDENAPLVTCVPGAINQVILNMVVNAAHAIADAKKPGLGKITLRTRAEEKMLLVQISDTGTGMPEAIKKKIFDPFFTTKEVGRGTGQGLAISWDIIVKKHQGSISIDSQEGEGTTLSIRLPLARKEGTPPDPQQLS